MRLRPCWYVAAVGVAVWLVAPGDLAHGQQPDPKKNTNPITDWFRKVDRGVKGEPEPADPVRAGKDQFDSRTPQRPEIARRLNEAEAAIRERRWNEAVDLLQFLLERTDDSLVLRDDGEWESLHAGAERLLQSAPEEVQRDYATRFEMVARAQWERAVSAQNEAGLVEIVHRFFHTEAGRRALELLAVIWRDRGEFSASAAAYQKLAKTGRDSSAAQRFRWLAAECLALAGRPETAKELASRGTRPDWFTVPATPEADRTRERPEGSPPPLSSPLLLPKWSVEAVSQYGVHEQIQVLLSDLEEQEKAPVPVQVPLIIGDKVAVRTLRGIEVRRCETGELVWSVAPPGNPEEQLRGEFEDQGPWPQQDEIDPYESGAGDSHQLASILYRNTVYGSMTTDGRQLFAVDQERALEPEQAGFYWRSRFGNRKEATPISNSLAAYDLHSGLVRWRVGGPELEPPFSRPLAGSYFFGPPTVAGDELYSVGEQEGDIYLHCLSSRTGEALWSQMIATAGRPVSEDLVRRWWRCAPVVSEGLVICPTTTGWLVAVDRHLHELRWVYRYMLRTPSTRQFRGGYAAHSVQDLNVRWQSTPPLVADGKLVLSPPELPDEFGSTQPLLACLDLHTGSELWRQPKGEMEAISVEGIWRGDVVLATRHSVKGIRLGSGNIAWEIAFPKGSGLPCGRGVLMADNYLVPLTDGTLVRIDLASRDIRRFKVPDATPGLGSLAAGEGALVSLSPLSLCVFPPKPTGDELLAAARSNDPAERFRRAEVLAAEGETATALAALLDREIQEAAGSDAQLAGRVRQLEWQLRVALFLEDVNDPTGQLPVLRELASTPEQKRLVGRAGADHLTAIGQLEAALRAYLDLLDGSESVLVQEGTREVRLDRWISGRVESLLSSASPAERKRLDDLLREKVDEQLETNADPLPLLAGVFRFHPLSQQLHWQLGVELEEEQNLTLAATAFRRAAGGNDAVLAARAEERFEALQGRLAAEIDAVVAPSAAIEHGPSVHQEVKNGNARNSPSRPTVHGSKLEVIRTSDSDRPLDLLGVYESGEPFWGDRRFRYLYEMESTRLCVEDMRSGRIIWSAALRSLPVLEYHGPCSVHQQGAITYALHQGVVHAFSVGEHRRLWTFEPQMAGGTSKRLRAPARPANYNLLNPEGFLANYRLGMRPKPQGYFQDAGDEGALIFTDSLVLLDPANGEVLWRDHGISKSAMAWLLGDEVLVVAPGELPQLRRLADGAPIERGGLKEACGNAVAVAGGRIVALDEERSGGGGKKSWTIRARSLPDFSDAWSVPVSAETSLTMLDEDSWCLLSPDRTLSLLDLATGTSRTLGRLPEELKYGRGTLVATSDRDRIYIVADFGRTGASYIGVTSVRANGVILAFDKHEGGPLWELDTTLLGAPAEAERPNGRPRRAAAPEDEADKIPLSLSLQEFEDCPLLVFLGDRPVNKDDLYFRQLRVLCVDKETREVVLDWVRPSDSGGFSQLHYDALHAAVELRTYNERLQIRLNRPVAPAPPGSTTP